MSLVKTGDLVHEYLLTGDRAFVRGRQNADFQGEWDGIWVPPLKIADSARFLLWHDGRLDRVLGNSFSANYGYSEHRCSLEDLDVLITTVVPEGLDGVLFLVQITNKASAPKSLHLFADIQVALRSSGSNGYSLDMDDLRRFVITADGANNLAVFGAYLIPSAFRLGDFSDYLIAGGSLQGDGIKVKQNAGGRSCLQYDVGLGAGKVANFSFLMLGESLSRSAAMMILNQVLKDLDLILGRKKQIYLRAVERCKVRTPNAELDLAMDWAKVNLQMAVHNKPAFGRGLLAGYPKLTNYLGRDCGWVVPAIDVCGAFGVAEEVLTALARFQSTSEKLYQSRRVYPGEIPGEIGLDGSVAYNAVDATPLFVIASWHHIMWGGSAGFLRRIYPSIVNAVNWGLMADGDRDHLIEDRGDGTWMASCSRPGRVVEVQALWCQALWCASKLAEMYGDRGNMMLWRKKHDALRPLLVERFWEGNLRYLRDVVASDGSEDLSITINAVVPLLFQLLGDDKATDILDRLEREFTTDWGVRTRSIGDSSYDGSSPHRGCVWGLTTGWAASAELNYDRASEGLWYLEKLAKMVKAGAPGCFPEFMHGDRPELLGDSLRTWSASAFVQGMVEGLLGVKADAPYRLLEVSPCIPEEWGEVAIGNLKFGDATVSVMAKAERGEKTLLVQSDRPISVRAGFRFPKIYEVLSVRRGSDMLPRSSFSIVERQRSNRLFVVGTASGGRPLVLKVEFGSPRL